MTDTCRGHIGVALCGSFCTISKSLAVMEQLKKEGWHITPLLSDAVYHTDTRFGEAAEIRRRVEALCGEEIIHSIRDAEPLGPKIRLDALLIMPCTGNTLSKMAHGITDTTVTMAAKAQLRRDGAVVIALASNDALSANLCNIGTMLCRKQVYFVPLAQDDPEKKPHSLICDFSQVADTLDCALRGTQLQPIFC